MEIIAQERTIFGKKVRFLRREGLIPASVFGKDFKNLSLAINEKEFSSLYKTAGETSLVDLKVKEAKPFKVLISQVQRHPVTKAVVAVSFYKVNLTEKITANIPLVFVGESPAVHAKEGILLTLMDELEVACLPADLPQHIEVDISGLLKIDDAVAVKDLKLDRGKVEVKAEPEELIVKVDYAQQPEQEEETPVSEEELVSQVEATKELTEEEKAKREEEKKEGAKPEKSDKKSKEK
ncbi:50S ribosomal protein L25 [Candidatus Parcubacteria bacterium]|nr:50S ribosomal protein L25 [Patescibacteria group bacterium]MBU4381049.1 50S ribosomal protein L25 [Patescibacteria group bacterium]MCG2689048.1 50S ribosomal protein L25 [Candidatus Parcubacteria bacterium]